MLSWKIQRFASVNTTPDSKHALVFLLEHKEAINVVWNAVKPREPNTEPEITSKDEIIKSDS